MRGTPALKGGEEVRSDKLIGNWNVIRASKPGGLWIKAVVSPKPEREGAIDAFLDAWNGLLEMGYFRIRGLDIFINVGCKVGLMPKKRKNRGRHKGDKGKESVVYCDNCGRRVPRSKAVRVTVPYSPVPGDLAKDLEKQGALITRYYVTKTYCVNCAIYMGILKVRSENERKTERRPATTSRVPAVPKAPQQSNSQQPSNTSQQSNTQQ